MANAKRFILVALGILIGVALVVFLLTNKTPVTITFLWVESVELWLSVVVMIAAMAGLLIGLFYTLLVWMRLRGQIRELKRKLAAAQEELIAHRNQLMEEPEFFDPMSRERRSDGRS
jgi:uncharacterized integral membrane protein